MKMILLCVCAGALFTSTGCVYRGDRHGDAREHWQYRHDDARGVDHAEHPGDMEHGDRQ